MLHIKRSSSSGIQLLSFYLCLSLCDTLCLGRLLITQALITSFPAIFAPGGSLEDNLEVDSSEQIWMNLDKVLRDAGFTLWPDVHISYLRIADHLSRQAGLAPYHSWNGIGALGLSREL